MIVSLHRQNDKAAVKRLKKDTRFSIGLLKRNRTMKKFKTTVAMLLISIFSIRVTSIALMLIAALIGLIVFLIAKGKEGGAG